MSKENLSCCNADNSDCNTQKTNCCSTEQKPFGRKKIVGLGILLIAITFAIVSAFTTSNTDEKASCGTGETSCETSCETGSTETSCCSKK